MVVKIRSLQPVKELAKFSCSRDELPQLTGLDLASVFGFESLSLLVNPMSLLKKEANSERSHPENLLFLFLLRLLRFLLYKISSSLFAHID
jgi:hypothetical protein